MFFEECCGGEFPAAPDCGGGRDSDGGDSGALAGEPMAVVPLPGATLMLIFIPARQCNELPQTKYLVPGFVKWMVVFPPVLVWTGLAVLQLS